MKFPGIAFVVCLGYISCIPAALVNITVSENAGFDRVGETVEINLSDIPTISAYAPEGNFYLISKNTREKLAHRQKSVGDYLLSRRLYRF